MANGLRYETGRDMPPGMQQLVADQIVQRIQKATPVAEFTCARCGCPTNNSEEIGSLTLHFCDACNDAIDREVRWESEGATHRKDQVICPICGYEYDPYESLRFDEDETTDAACECCGRHFKVEVTTVRYYSTRRSISEMPPDWQPNGEDT